MSLNEFFSRTAMLIGETGMNKLNSSKIVVFGVGGVGSFVVEALARCGVARLDICDADTVSVTNINRQIIALHSTVGRKKVDVMRDRIVDISPDTRVDTFDFFYDNSTKDNIDLSNYDYIVDAIDSMESKILLIKEAKKSGTPIISSLSTGNKMYPERFEITDIYKTVTCPIAKILRKRLKEENVDSLKVVYSPEPPITPDTSFLRDSGKRTVGSISFVPSSAGLLIASAVVKDLIEFRR